MLESVSVEIDTVDAAGRMGALLSIMSCKVLVLVVGWSQEETPRGLSTGAAAQNNDLAVVLTAALMTRPMFRASRPPVEVLGLVFLVCEALSLNIVWELILGALGTLGIFGGFSIMKFGRVPVLQNRSDFRLWPIR